MQEAKQLDNRMRDAYSQLRRSAYDMGSSAAPADDTGGVRIKPPRSPTSPSNNSRVHTRLHSREITLLENGMIVEHVDVRKEEREARERKRKEERRARKSSRSSIMDVSSIISAQSYAPPTESGLGLKPFSRYSQHTSGRPTSALTAPLERVVPSGYSQVSFSDVHSLASGSPGRPRFFGFKNLSSGGRSRDSLAPSGMSGSMVDMQCVVLCFPRRVQVLICVYNPALLSIGNNTPNTASKLSRRLSTSILLTGARFGPPQTLLQLKLRRHHKTSQRKRREVSPRSGVSSPGRRKPRPQISVSCHLRGMTMTFLSRHRPLCLTS
jgi:hypothetical protein